MVNFYVQPSSSRITLTVAMETVHLFHCAIEFIFGDKTYLHFGVQINDLAPVKNSLGGCKVGQISY